MNADDAREMRRAAAMQRLIAMNDELIRRRAVGTGLPTTHVFVVDAETGLDLRAEVERHYRERGFDVVSTYGGIGLSVAF